VSRHALACRLLGVLLVTALGIALVPVWGQVARGKKYALLVGVNVYEHAKLAPLKYAENDASTLGEVLRRAGYEVVVLTGSAKTARLRPTRVNIEARLKEMLDRCRRGDTALVALAGHGLQLAGKSDAYFCPSDARPFATRTDSLVSLTKIYRALDESLASVKLLLVDACRNDPESSRGVDDTAPRPPRGVAALFSCSSGERAFETEKLGGGHGVFFHFVIEGLRGKAKNARGAVTWGGLVEYVTEQVSDEVPRLIRDGARQTPHLRADIKGKSPVLLSLAAGGILPDSPIQGAITDIKDGKITVNVLKGKFEKGKRPEFEKKTFTVAADARVVKRTGFHRGTDVKDEASTLGELQNALKNASTLTPAFKSVFARIEVRGGTATRITYYPFWRLRTRPKE
jgi:hypothetical protein